MEQGLHLGASRVGLGRRAAACPFEAWVCLVRPQGWGHLYGPRVPQTIGRQRRTVRVRVRTKCALRRRPPAGRHKFQGRQSGEDPLLEMSPLVEPIACDKCGDELPAHMRAAAGKLSSRLRVPERKVMDLLPLGGTRRYCGSGKGPWPRR